jgi:VCBS repeat-containing protein
MAAKTTAKVSLLTGAAKDDVLGGGTEDATTSDLNVLANDPGAARLWSLDQGVASLAGGSQVASALGSFTLGSGATISANVDGTIHYDGSGVDLQYLAEGEIYTDTFIYTVRMANGALSTASVSVQVTGVNDIAVITGDDDGSVTEDGTLTAGGTLVVTDADHDQSAFGTVGDLAGDYGDFLFDSDTGEWSYTLRNDDEVVQALNAGDVRYDTLDVASLDGTGTMTVTVTINGADEPPPPVEEDGGDPEFLVNNGKQSSSHNIFDGFGEEDTLYYVGGLTFASVELEDRNADGSVGAGDGTMDTIVNFVQNGNGNPVEAVLVGYANLDLVPVQMV